MDKRGVKILPSGEGHNELTKQYPKLSGFLQSAFMGEAPDEIGSVLDPLTADRQAGARAGFPLSIAAQVAPIAKAAALATRTGRNVGRVLTNAGPLQAAYDEIGRVPSPFERSVASSPRGWAGPVSVGDATSVEMPVSSRLAQTSDILHTHPITNGRYNPLSAGDRSREGLNMHVLHATTEGDLTGLHESLPGGNPPWLGTGRTSDSYMAELRGKPGYESNVPDDQYQDPSSWLQPGGDSGNLQTIDPRISTMLEDHLKFKKLWSNSKQGTPIQKPKLARLPEALKEFREKHGISPEDVDILVSGENPVNGYAKSGVGYRKNPISFDDWMKQQSNNRSVWAFPDTEADKAFAYGTMGNSGQYGQEGAAKYYLGDPTKRLDTVRGPRLDLMGEAPVVSTGAPYERLANQKDFYSSPSDMDRLRREYGPYYQDNGFGGSDTQTQIYIPNLKSAMEQEAILPVGNFAGGGLVSKLGPMLEGLADMAKGTKVADVLGKPIEVYHGTSNPIVGPIKSPAFFTSDKSGAQWYAKNRGDGAPTVHKAILNIKNPLDISNKQGAMKLIDHARDAGVHVNVNDPGQGAPWEFYSKDISAHSPYDGESPQDLLYVPKVRDALQKAGHDGVFLHDQLSNSTIPTWIPLDKSQVHHIGSDVVDDAQNFASGGHVETQTDRDRQQRLNMEHSNQVLKQMARGWVAGTAGLPHDLDNLARMFIRPHTDAGSAVGDWARRDSPAPSTDFYNEWLPGASDDSRLQAAAEIANLTGGMGLGLPAKLAARSGAAIARHAGRMVDSGMHGEGALAKVLAPAQPFHTPDELKAMSEKGWPKLSPESHDFEPDPENFAKGGSVHAKHGKHVLLYKKSGQFDTRTYVPAHNDHLPRGGYERLMHKFNQGGSELPVREIFDAYSKEALGGGTTGNHASFEKWVEKQ